MSLQDQKLKTPIIMSARFASISNSLTQFRSGRFYGICTSSIEEPQFQEKLDTKVAKMLERLTNSRS